MTKGSSLFFIQCGRFPLQTDAFRGHGFSLLDEQKTSPVSLRQLRRKQVVEPQLVVCGVFSSCTCRFAFGAENICYSRRKDIGRTVIRPISLRRVIAGAHVFSPSSNPINLMFIFYYTNNNNCLICSNLWTDKKIIFLHFFYIWDLDLEYKFFIAKRGYSRRSF